MCLLIQVMDGLNMDPHCKKSHLADKLDIVACTLEGEETSACWRQPSDDEEEYDGEVEDVDTEDDDETFEMQLNDLDYDDHHFANHHSSPAPRQRRMDKSHHQQQQLQNKEWPLTWWPQIIPVAHNAVTVNDRERLLPTTDSERRRQIRKRSNTATLTTASPHRKLASNSHSDDKHSPPPSPLHRSASKNDGDNWEKSLKTQVSSSSVYTI